MGGSVFHDFLVGVPTEIGVDALLARRAEIEDSLAAVLNGQAENDGFNRLIGAAGLSPREANWLRAWYRYLRQTGLGVDLVTAVSALRRAGTVTRGLIDLFLARHDPLFAGDRDSAEIEAEEAIRLGLAQVAAISDDRLLRAFHALVHAILRTNAFAPAGEEALAFKIESGAVPGLPRPVPWREIFVYSPRVEGIHLRAGPVARGGLRWSDRRDDFRTEILGLMKAQRVKNAVIVPTGAKGGFYPKQLPDPARDRDGWLAEGRASYQVFIRALLSVTDNIVTGSVAHPAGVVLRDGDDPYFVAADKGTATFSDTANAIATEHDFWLDDAFASGGSKGYDHKAMGITARGAWISVQRHFRELGLDVQEHPVSVVGVGDMSGDVFGNGMLLSQAIRLVAAFDHRHIFLDPDPDPTRAWQERARMFALPRSSWDDYDRTVLSEGGGIFPRSQKSIPLSPQVRALLGLEIEAIDPDTLISLILTAPVDLLWFGGIGTYVRASHENNVTVGDPANDAVRVSANEVRARVIGEGANLGMTQAARIEFSIAGAGGLGGRVNTDFIDNSAGVDCSDNEVNIKIALASAKRAGRLDEDGRVRLLVEMTDAVSALVLADNRLQALALRLPSGADRRRFPRSRVWSTCSRMPVNSIARPKGWQRRKTMRGARRPGMGSPVLKSRSCSRRPSCSSGRSKKATWSTTPCSKRNSSPLSPKRCTRILPPISPITGCGVKSSRPSFPIASSTAWGRSIPSNWSKRKGAALLKWQPLSSRPNACSISMRPGPCSMARTWPKRRGSPCTSGPRGPCAGMLPTSCARAGARRKSTT
jgi:glutamate dehydrogenase